MKIIIVPGNFGSTLANNGIPLWVNPWSLALGKFAQFKLGPYKGALNETNFDPKVNITATGLVPGMYSLLEFGLYEAGFTVLHFAYDWRVDADSVAIQLNKYIESLN